MAAQWQDFAARRDYTFLVGGLCPQGHPHPHAHMHVHPPAPPPPPKRSVLDRLLACLSCQCIYDPVPPYPPGAHLACIGNTHVTGTACACAGGAASGSGGGGGNASAARGAANPACTCSPGPVDSKAAKAHLAEAKRLAKLNEKAYYARAAAEAKDAARRKRDKEKQEAQKKKDKERADAEAKKAKSREEAAKKAAEAAQKREMAKFQAWARRNGCTAIPPPPPPAPAPPPAPPPAPACMLPFGGGCVCPACCRTHIFMPMPAPQDWGVARAPFVDAFGVAWPPMSHTMMQAVRDNNHQEALLRIANGPRS